MKPPVVLDTTANIDGAKLRNRKIKIPKTVNNRIIKFQFIV